nr:ferredoxin [Haloplanus sp. XH21]
MTRYQIHLDRGACEGIFACLVRDDRFVEADDGLATVEGATGEATVTVDCDDDRLADARDAAAACPVDAITVEEGKP